MSNSILSCSGVISRESKQSYNTLSSFGILFIPLVNGSLEFEAPNEKPHCWTIVSFSKSVIVSLRLIAVTGRSSVSCGLQITEIVLMRKCRFSYV